MLHPRSETQIFATLDALCEKVGRHSNCNRQSWSPCWPLLASAVHVFSCLWSLTWAEHVLQATKKLGEYYTVPCQR